ncbi:MAG TPA: hypothetical protein VMG37_25445 [Solirubrobacteraceae bacterium]|nr:hypothetical protein [Solirubrobacteraceae bacterium]
MQLPLSRAAPDAALQAASGTGVTIALLSPTGQTYVNPRAGS